MLQFYNYLMFFIKYSETLEQWTLWKGVNPRIRAKLQLCKPVVLNHLTLRSSYASVVATKALQNEWPLLMGFNVLSYCNQNAVQITKWSSKNNSFVA